MLGAGVEGVLGLALRAGPLGVMVLGAIAQPLRLIPPAQRQIVGWLAIITAFNALFVWLALMLKG